MLPKVTKPYSFRGLSVLKGHFKKEEEEEGRVKSLTYIGLPMCQASFKVLYLY